jgi:hypothetical protein
MPGSEKCYADKTSGERRRVFRTTGKGEIAGVCLVQLASRGKISRNEVYFDRTGVFAEIAKLKQRNK